MQKYESKESKEIYDIRQERLSAVNPELKQRPNPLSATRPVARLRLRTKSEGKDDKDNRSDRWDRRLKIDESDKVDKNGLELKLKRILELFNDKNDGKDYIKTSAAYDLGLAQVNQVMDMENEYFEVNEKAKILINRLVKEKVLEIEYKEKGLNNENNKKGRKDAILEILSKASETEKVESIKQVKPVRRVLVGEYAPKKTEQQPKAKRKIRQIMLGENAPKKIEQQSKAERKIRQVMVGENAPKKIEQQPKAERKIRQVMVGENAPKKTEQQPKTEKKIRQVLIKKEEVWLDRFKGYYNELDTNKENIKMKSDMINTIKQEIKQRDIDKQQNKNER